MLGQVSNMTHFWKHLMCKNSDFFYFVVNYTTCGGCNMYLPPKSSNFLNLLVMTEIIIYILFLGLMQ